MLKWLFLFSFIACTGGGGSEAPKSISKPDPKPTPIPVKSITLVGENNGYLNSTSASVLFSNFESKKRVHIYDDLICSNLDETFDLSSSSETLTLTVPRIEGSNELSFEFEDSSGNKEGCYSTSFAFTVDTIEPATGNAIVLITPSTVPNPNHESDPVVEVQGVSSGDIVGVYDDSLCGSLVGEATSSSTSIQLTLADMKAGSSQLYTKSRDLAGNESVCSSSLLSYTYSNKLSGVLTFDFVPNTSGSLDYENIIQKPMRNVYVELVRSSDDSVLQSLSTNDLGEYEFILNEDVEAYLNIWAEMKTPSVVIEDNTNSDAIYIAQTSDYDLDKSIVVNINAPSGWVGSNSSGNYLQTRVAGPFAILDSVYSAIKKISTERPTVVFPDLKVNWSVNNIGVDGDTSQGEIGTSHYNPAEKELYILGKSNSDTDEYDQHVIVHEWGHYFEDQLARSDSLGGSHGTGDVLDISVAFSEAFANALSGIVLEPEITYIDTGGLRQQTTYVSSNLESGADPIKGWFSERSIEQILFDIYDSNDDGADSVSIGLGPIYDVLTNHYKNSSSASSIFSFINGLKTELPTESSGIDALVLDKSISTISDDYGTGQTVDGGWNENLPIYSSLVVGGPNITRKLYGYGENYNKLVNGRLFRFSATSANTRVTMVSAVDTYILRILKNGVEIVYDEKVNSDGNPFTNIHYDFATTSGDEYIVHVLTHPDFVFNQSIYVDIEINVANQP